MDKSNINFYPNKRWIMDRSYVDFYPKKCISLEQPFSPYLSFPYILRLLLRKKFFTKSSLILSNENNLNKAIPRDE